MILKGNLGILSFFPICNTEETQFFNFFQYFPSFIRRSSVKKQEF